MKFKTSKSFFPSVKVIMEEYGNGFRRGVPSKIHFCQFMSFLAFFGFHPINYHPIQTSIFHKQALVVQMDFIVCGIDSGKWMVMQGDVILFNVDG